MSLFTGCSRPLDKVGLAPKQYTEPPEVGIWMGGMVAVSSPYAGGVRGPGVGDAFLNCRGSYTFSKPNSLLIMASHPAALISSSVAYG